MFEIDSLASLQKLNPFEGMNFRDLITIEPKRSIEKIVAQVTLEETSTDELHITEHPVERGANITDHAYKLPPEVTIHCGWSNASWTGLYGTMKGSISALRQGDLCWPDYVSGIYNQLLALQESRIPFDVSTGRRKYTNMLMRSLTVVTDQKTENALLVTAVFKNVRIVSTTTTILLSRGVQADPGATSEVIDKGDKSVAIAYPAPGGWKPPNG